MEKAAEASRLPLTGGPPFSDPIAPPGLADGPSTARFGTFWRELSDHTLSERRMREVVWFELDLHLPIDGETGGHAKWPRLETDPRGGAGHVCRAYSSATLASRWLPGPPAVERLVHTSGIEALRWLHAAPSPPERMFIDWFEGSPAWMEVPVTLAVSAVFPHFQRIDDLGAVERVAMTRLGASPPTGGLRPQVARALLVGWRDLVGFAHAPTAVAYAGGRWLPVFSDLRQAFAFARTHRDFQLARVGVAPAFLEWMAAARDVDGIILDPESPTPLPLDHTALLLLDLWGPTPGEQPDGGDLVRAVARQLAAGAIPPRLAARVIADWPRYHIVAPRNRRGTEGFPEGERALVFSRIEDAEQLLALAAAGETMIIPGDSEIISVLHGWRRSAFHLIASAFGGALIDPTLDDAGRLAGGVVLDDVLVRAAAERVDEHLRPRIPSG